jgi:hypothetical protein
MLSMHIFQGFAKNAYFSGRSSDPTPAFLNAARALSPHFPSYQYPAFLLDLNEDTLKLSKKSKS